MFQKKIEKSTQCLKNKIEYVCTCNLYKTLD